MKYFFSSLCFLLLLSSCVSKKKYNELQEVKNYYEKEASVVDSLNNTIRNLRQEINTADGYLKQALHEVEQMKVANRSLNNSYQDLLKKYNRLIEQNSEVLSTTSYEKQSLQERLSAYQAELDRKERYLRNLEMELAQREERLNYLQNTYGGMEENLEEREQRIQELEAQLALNKERLERMRQGLSEALRGFAASDLSISERNGRLYVSMSQNLLFPSGSSRIDSQGKRALDQLAGALMANKDLDIIVEGHTDTDGTAARNWDLSVMRATAVVKELTASGVDPKRISACGKAFYAPVATNETATGKAQNRRTEIILTPKLEELYKLVNPE
ncbi:MAG: OmpA family protein [Saprospiraceae bacterium]|nr:OmpA family protein [Saprospiraceae bacterium]